MEDGSDRGLDVAGPHESRRGSENLAMGLVKLRPGRASVFRGKRTRVQGLLTPAGAQQFERARRRLATLAGRAADDLSDADVIEFLARGEAKTRTYLLHSLMSRL